MQALGVEVVSIRFSLSATAMLVLAGCCNDIGGDGPVLRVTTKNSTGADRVEIVVAKESWSCDANAPVDSCVVRMANGETTFSLFYVPDDSQLTLKIFAGDKMLSEETVKPVWKDNNQEDQCQTYPNCKLATIER